MGIITDYVSKYSKMGDDLADRAVQQYGEWLGKGQDIKKQWENIQRETSRSWIWDNREPMSGEAKVIHPFQFADLTPLRWLGVTRLPLMGAKGVEAGVKVGKALSKAKIPKVTSTWKPKLPKTNKKSLKRIGASAAIAGSLMKPLLTKTGKTLGKAGTTTLKTVKKHPKKTLAIGTLGATLLTQRGSRNSGDEDSENLSWMGRRRVSRRKWV